MADASPISGLIDPKAFPFLLVDLHRHGATGSLKVEGPSYQKALYFRGGRVLFGSSNDPRDQLGSILIESGKITPEQLEDVSAKMGPGSPLAKVLADTGFVNQRELGEAAQVKVERILSDVLSYDTGSFEFEDGVLPKGAVDLKLSTEKLVLSAVRRISDRNFVLRHLEGLDVTFAPSLEATASVPELEMDAEDLLEQIDGSATLKEAAARTRLDEFDAAKIACALLFLGVIKRTQPAHRPGAGRAPAAQRSRSRTRTGPSSTSRPPCTPRSRRGSRSRSCRRQSASAGAAAPSRPSAGDPVRTPGARSPPPPPPPSGPERTRPALSLPDALVPPPPRTVTPTPVPAARFNTPPPSDREDGLPLVPPPTLESAATRAVTRPSKDDLAAVDALLNSRTVEGPMAAFEKNDGSVDRWTPEFGVRAPMNPLARGPRSRGPLLAVAGLAAGGSRRGGRVVLPARGARHEVADGDDARGQPARPVADGRERGTGSDDSATGGRDRRPHRTRHGRSDDPCPDGDRPRGLRTRQPGAGPRAHAARPAPAGGTRVRVEREGRARRHALGPAARRLRARDRAEGDLGRGLAGALHPARQLPGPGVLPALLGHVPDAGPRDRRTARPAALLPRGRRVTQDHAHRVPAAVRRHSLRLPTVLAFACLCAIARADVITLTNGRVIEADRSWYEGAQLRYEKNGGVYGLPKSLVKTVEQKRPAEAAGDPDVARARQRLAARDPVQATRLLRAALARDPHSVPALHALAEAYLALGDARAAKETAERALRVDTRDARARELLGDALVAWATARAPSRSTAGASSSSRMRRSSGSSRRWRRRPRPPPPVRERSSRCATTAASTSRWAPPCSTRSTAAYSEYARRFAFRPDEPISVVLETESAFQDGRVPDWAAGVNDGGIRVAVRGLDGPNPRLLSVLRHELAHSFVAARTRGNCPTWLHEGIAQWLEGGDPTREDAVVSAALAESRLLPLLTLEAPFQTLPPTEISIAYAESLSAVAHIIQKRGDAGLVRLLAALGDGFPSEEALPVALALSYPEFQKSWEQSLRGGAAAARP